MANRLLTRRRLRRLIAGLMHYSGLKALMNRLAAKPQIRILMYHNIAEDGDPHSIPPALFETQMRWLAGHHVVVPLEQISQYYHQGSPLPDQVVALTFDDGFLSHYTTVYPVLKRYRLPATFFITPGWLSSPDAANDTFMGWEQLHALDPAWITIGSHTSSHRALARLSEPQRQAELSHSKAWLEAQLGRPVLFFAYPFGGPHDVSAAAMAEAQACGYHLAVTAQAGVNHPRTNPYALWRTEVERTDDLFIFSHLLQGALDNPLVRQGWRWWETLSARRQKV